MGGTVNHRTAIRRMTRVDGVGDAAPFGYAQCVVANGFVFVAGQSGVDENRRLAGRSFREQAVKTFENLRTVLDAAGSTFDRLLSITVYLADASHIPELVSVRKEALGANLPASTLVTGVRLADPAWLVEVDAIALLPENEDGA